MYIILETQTNAAGEVSTLVSTKTTRPEADAEFYTKLAYVAMSNVPTHAVTLLDNEGNAILSKCYRHSAAEAGE